MGKLSKKKVGDLSKILPQKDRQAIIANPPTVAQLNDWIKHTEELMKRDVQMGIPLLIAYAISLIFFQQQWALIALTVIAILYFSYTTFTTGTYGLNRRRLKVYKALLNELEK